MSVRPGDAPSRQRPAGLFVGREQEMATLGTALDGVVSGQGSLVIVAGEAGIGKSRLAEAFAEEARARGVRVVWGHSWEAGGAPAFWPWVQVLRGLIRTLDGQQIERVFAVTGAHVARIVPDLRDPSLARAVPSDSPDVSESVRFELFDAIARSLRELSSDGPILIVLDDLHAADEPSLLLLRFVCGELADAPILFLATYREGELGPDDPRLGHLAELGRQPGSTHVSPRSLSEQAVGRYLELALAGTLPAGLVDSVHRQSEGNPLFMTEVVRLLVDEQRMERFEESQRLEIPDGIRAVIGRRLTRLSPESRSLLDRASVIGVDLPLDQLTGTRERPDKSILGLLDEAARADVLIVPARAGGPWRFKHALIREVVYSALPAAERMRLHLSVAEVLEELHRDDPVPPHAVLAHHYVEAVPTADPRRAIEHSRRAAHQATEQAAHEEAVRLYRRALTIAQNRDDTRVDLLNGLGEAAARAGDLSASRSAHLEAADLAERLGLAEAMASAAVGYGGRFGWLRAGADGLLVPLLERALQALPTEDSRYRVRLLARLAGALRGDPNMDRRVRLGEEALSMARRVGDTSTLVFALVSRYFSMAGPDATAALSSLAHETMALATTSGDREQICQAHLLLYDTLATSGAPHAALRSEIDAFGQLAHALRQPSIVWYHSVLRTIFAINEGRLDAAEQLIEEAYRLGERTLDRDATVSRLLCTFALRREQGRLAETADVLGRAPADFPDYPFFACIALYVDSVTGSSEEARRQLDRLAVDDFAFLPRDMSWLFGMNLLAETALVLGDQERMLAIERRLVPFQGCIGLATSEITSGPISRILGLLAAADGRYDEALDHLEAARRGCAISGLVTFEVRLRVEIADVVLRRGGPDATERAASEAADALEMARSAGLPATEHQAGLLLARLETVTSNSAGAAVDATTGPTTLFRREGEAWRIGEGRVFLLRHAKGLAYLAMLLDTPGQEHHVLDMVAVTDRPADASWPTGQAGHDAEMHLASGAIPDGGLDDEAKRAYRDRLRQLQVDLAEAESSNHAVDAERARWEMEALRRELSAAYGLGGRARPERSASERARQSVSKAIRESIARIQRQDPALGSHLRRAVRTGVFCSYDPDPSARRRWRLS